MGAMLSPIQRQGPIVAKELNKIPIDSNYKDISAKSVKRTYCDYINVLTRLIY